MKSILTILIVLSCSFSHFSYAAESQINCDESLGKIEVNSKVSQALAPVIDLITEQRLKLCKSLDKNGKPDLFKRKDAVMGLADGLPLSVEKYLFSVFPQNAKTTSSELIRQILKAATEYSEYLKKDPYREFLESTYRAKENTINFKFGSKPDFGVISELSECKRMLIPTNQEKPMNGVSCKLVFTELASTINAFGETIEDIEYKEANAEIKATLQKWSRFNENARAMTLLDSVVTYRLNGGYYKQVGNDGPADLQFFLFHPSVLYEHVPSAVRGDRTDVSLGLEIFGANCWDCFEGKFPIGASATVVYTDRPEVSEFGVGLGIHLFNHYTIGYTYRDEGSGFYIDINLTEWLTDNDAHLKRGLQTLVDRDVITDEQAKKFSH